MATKKKAPSKAPSERALLAVAIKDAAERLTVGMIRSAELLSESVYRFGETIRYAITENARATHTALMNMHEMRMSEIRLELLRSGSKPAADGALSPDTLYSVVLVSTGPTKIQVIKAIRELTGLGLKEAKDLTDLAPSVVLAKVDAYKAEAAGVALRAAGAIATMRVHEPEGKSNGTPSSEPATSPPPEQPPA